MIRALHEALVRKKLSAVELTDKYLSAINSYDSALNSYITVTEREARATARLVDKKIANGEEIGLLEGIPMSVKDNISTKGIITSCGSKMLKDYKPVYDAYAVEQLRLEGAVLLGKTNMDEFGMGSTGESSYYGATRNPYHRNFVSGGSSGGAAVSVAADLAVFGLGSDTGGSIRLPASFCGVVGLKPSYGAVSRYGLIAYASSLDQIGVLGKDTEDVAIVFDRISKADCRDSTCHKHKRSSAVSELEKPLKGRKIGVLTELFQGVSSELEQSLQQAIIQFRYLGAEIVEVSVPDSTLSLPVYYILACGECASNLARFDGVRYGARAKHFESIEEMIVTSRNEGFGLEVKQRIMMGNYFLRSANYDDYYRTAQRVRASLCKDVEQCFAKADLLLSPTVHTSAFPLGALKDAVSRYQTDLCTVLANLCGLPAVSVPCGVDKTGLPFGLQLMGNKFCEHILLNAAYQYEQTTIESCKPKFGGDTVGI